MKKTKKVILISTITVAMTASILLKTNANYLNFIKTSATSPLGMLATRATDQTSPTISSIEPNGNTNWAKSQSVVINLTDDTSSSENIDATYVWRNVETGEEKESGEFKSGETITKNTDTGKFNILITAEDEAGNSSMKLSEPFYLDNSVTQIGDVAITRNSKDGEVYPVAKNSEGIYEGGYTQDNLYLSKIDGTDNESGHASTTYQVDQILEDGTTKAVGTPTTEDTIIETDGKYQITVTTKDNAGNTVTKKIIIKKGQNKDIEITPNGNTEKELSVSVKVTLTGENAENTEIYYAWKEVGTTPEESDYKKTTSGSTIRLNNVNGDYILWIKTTDDKGNTSITTSNVYHLVGKVENTPEMILKLNSENGEDYTPDTFTNQNVYAKLKETETEENGYKVTSTYKIKQVTDEGEKTIVGPETNESTVLTNEGKYIIEVTSKSENGATGSKQYIVKIDKTAPAISFSGNEDYQNEGYISTNIKDTGISQAGVNIETARYYWTRNDKTPTKEDFFGTEEGGFRGKITNTSEKINLPEKVSGIWCLWIYVEDNVGNVSIKNNIKIDSDGNISYIDNEKPVAGEMTLKENNKEGNDYTPGTFTKNDIYMNLQNGYDADSGVKTNTYTIKKNNQTIKSSQTGENTITEHGIYNIIVTTTDNKENEATREYEVKIDKKGPQIKFIPGGNNEYAKTHEVEIQITEGTEESGVNANKTKAKWIHYFGEEEKTREEIINKIEEIKNNNENITEEELIEKLKQENIEIIDTEITNSKVKTPEGETGEYYLYVTAEDLVGNTSEKISEAPYKIDNTIPTKPDIYAILEEDNNKMYYGELTNQNVTVIAKNSQSVSGVDRYEYSISTDNGKTWSEFKEGTESENGEIIGKTKISESGNFMIKFRSVAEVLDGELISEETDIINVNIDKKVPKISFANYLDGKNGSEEYVQKILVRITAVDEGGSKVNPNTLKYEWVKFESIEEFENWKNSNPSIEEAREKMTQNAIYFSNGEEVASPDYAQGIYSIFVQAQDELGNQTIGYSNYYCLGEEGETNKGDYEIENNYIKRVKPETTISEFLNKIKTQIPGNEYKILDENNEEIKENEDNQQDETTDDNNQTEENNKTYVKTGNKLQVDGKIHEISVIGDLNGDGILDMIDLSKLILHLSEYTLLDEKYEISSDINFDKTIDLRDLSKMIQVLSKSIEL